MKKDYDVAYGTFEDFLVLVYFVFVLMPVFWVKFQIDRLLGRV